jgi:hypothetical protein
MPDEGIAHERARAAIQAAKIPIRRPDRMWGGLVPARRAWYPSCRSLAINLSLRSSSIASAARDKLHVHFRCFGAWELERTKVAGAPSDAFSASRCPSIQSLKSVSTRRTLLLRWGRYSAGSSAPSTFLVSWAVPPERGDRSPRPTFGQMARRS